MVAEDRKPSKRSNRKTRRARRHTAAQGLPWSGRCYCEHCNGRAWPHVYCYEAHVGRRKSILRDLRPHTYVSYECFIESLPHLTGTPGDKARWTNVEPAPVEGPSGTTESPSAAGIHWLEGLHNFGLNVDLGEVELQPEREDDLELEVVRHASFVKYVARLYPGDEDAQRAREKRYWALCGEFTGRRLHQWFYVEFPGWLTQQYHAKRGGK